MYMLAFLIGYKTNDMMPFITKYHMDTEQYHCLLKVFVAAYRMNEPPFPDFINVLSTAIVLLLRILEQYNENIIPLLPMQYLMASMISLLNVLSMQSNNSIVSVIRARFPVVRGPRQEVRPRLAEDSTQFWALTGETPISLASVVHIVGKDVSMCIRNPRQPRQRIRETRPQCLA